MEYEVIIDPDLQNPTDSLPLCNYDIEDFYQTSIKLFPKLARTLEQGKDYQVYSERIEDGREATQIENAILNKVGDYSPMR